MKLVESTLSNQIEKDLLDSGLEEDDLKDAIVQKVDSKLLEEQHIEIYKIAISYKWMEGLLVYKNNKFSGFISFMLLDRLYLIEGSDKDGLLAYGTMGSGLLYNQITYLKFKDRTIATNSFFNEMKGFDFKVVEDKIMVYSYDFKLQRTSSEPIGELVLKKNLIIEGLDAFGVN
ncbi:MAG: hypothetical protein JXR88_03750 [Clostridia bacterium]|nr:hypothetical protein [Clostridia bacterium]